MAAAHSSFSSTNITCYKGQMPPAEKIYEELKKAGVDAILDDREERPGVKFKDADLTGIPLRLTLGPKSLQNEEVEVRIRMTGEDRRWPLGEIVPRARRFIKEEMEKTYQEV